MMSVLAGEERTKSEWNDLLQSVGLHVTRIWVSPDGGDAEGIINRSNAQTLVLSLKKSRSF